MSLASPRQLRTPARALLLVCCLESYFGCLRLSPSLTIQAPLSSRNWRVNFATTTEGFAMNKKRAAPVSSEAPTTTTPKKRKTENLPKYYAVQAGFRPGVYLTYQECANQTTGFKGAVFKSFTSLDDANAFAAGKKVKPAADEPQRFYAVAVGNPTGIYTEWTDAAVAIKGVKGPKYKKFSSRAEAVGFIKEFGNSVTVAALGEDIVAEAPKPERKMTKSAQTILQNQVPDGTVRVYTDGSSLSNGKAGSRAGVGVYFGDNDSRNISERLPGELQTNQRAELMAMLRALDMVPSKQPVLIYSDSQYSINCVTQWAAGWKNKGWVTAAGEKVKNQDIIRSVLDKMDERTKAGGSTSFQWVKGHSADLGNAAADRLAVRGAKLSL